MDASQGYLATRHVALDKKPVHAHGLRHTHAFQLADEGLPDEPDWTAPHRPGRPQFITSPTVLETGKIFPMALG
jgi:hypothetical protein